MIAVDTNILVYRLDSQEPAKRNRARELLARLAVDPQAVLLWQVLGELIRQLRYWEDQKQITSATLRRYVRVFRGLFPLAMPTPEVVDHALALAARYSLSHWDSMLLGACKVASVTTLYTEDMGAPARYDNIELVNPFL